MIEELAVQVLIAIVIAVIFFALGWSAHGIVYALPHVKRSFGPAPHEIIKMNCTLLQQWIDAHPEHKTEKR